MGSGGDRPAADERKEDGSMVDRSSERVVSPECLTPAQIEAKAEDAAVAKVRLGAARAFVLAMFAGAFIAFGGLFFTVFLSDTTLSWGPQRVVGGLCFCLGLVLVLLCGAELFTGNALMVCALRSHRISASERSNTPRTPASSPIRRASSSRS